MARTEEAKTLCKVLAKGQTPNNGKLGKKDSEETREKKRLAALNRKPHSQATKDKIGAAHKGKIQPLDAVDRQKASMKLAIEANGGGFATGPRSDEFKVRMSGIAKSRPESEWRPKMEAAWEARRNQEITEEHRETYRQARIKFMNENPGALKDTAGELQIKEWLDEKGINYRQQWTLKPYGHPYDFYLPDFQTLIEFDGTHHWDRIWFNVSGKTDIEKSQLLKVQQEKDARENWEAGQKGLRIIRLWGWTKVGDAPGLPDFKEQMKIQGWLDF